MGLQKKRNLPLIVAGLVALAGLILVIVGIVLITKSKSKDCDGSASVTGQGGGGAGKTNRCSYSEEAKRAGVGAFLQKVQDKYYELHPQELIFNPGGVQPKKLKEKFKPYNPGPRNLKRISDAARDLLDELQALGVKTRQLKPREKKALAQVKHYLENNFGTPFDGDYYAGDFLMGPNLFCWQAICSVGASDIRYGLRNLHPKDLSDVQLVLDKMKMVAQTFFQYIENLKFGIKAGMVRSTEECIAGLNAFKRSYLEVSRKGDTGMWTPPPPSRDIRDGGSCLRGQYSLPQIPFSVSPFSGLALARLWRLAINSLV